MPVILGSSRVPTGKLPDDPKEPRTQIRARVLEILGSAPRSSSEIASTLAERGPGIRLSELVTELSEMASVGLVRQAPGGWVARETDLEIQIVRPREIGASVPWIPKNPVLPAGAPQEENEKRSRSKGQEEEGKKIRARRTEIGWSQKTLAEKAGTCIAYVAKLESGGEWNSRDHVRDLVARAMKSEPTDDRGAETPKKRKGDGRPVGGDGAGRGANQEERKSARGGEGPNVGVGEDTRGDERSNEALGEDPPGRSPAEGSADVMAPDRADEISPPDPLEEAREKFLAEISRHPEGISFADARRGAGIQTKLHGALLPFVRQAVKNGILLRRESDGVVLFFPVGKPAALRAEQSAVGHRQSASAPRQEPRKLEDLSLDEVNLEIESLARGDMRTNEAKRSLMKLIDVRDRRMAELGPWPPTSDSRPSSGEGVGSAPRALEPRNMGGPGESIGELPQDEPSTGGPPLTAAFAATLRAEIEKIAAVVARHPEGIQIGAAVVEAGMKEENRFRLDAHVRSAADAGLFRSRNAPGGRILSPNPPGEAGFDHDRKLGRDFATRRAALGLSQTQVAFEAGVTSSYVSVLENGRGPATEAWEISAGKLLAALERLEANGASRRESRKERAEGRRSAADPEISPRSGLSAGPEGPLSAGPEGPLSAGPEGRLGLSLEELEDVLERTLSDLGVEPGPIRERLAWLRGAVRGLGR